MRMCLFRDEALDARALDVRRFLKKRTETVVVVVCHAGFLRHIVRLPRGHIVSLDTMRHCRTMVSGLESSCDTRDSGTMSRRAYIASNRARQIPYHVMAIKRS